MVTVFLMLKHGEDQVDKLLSKQSFFHAKAMREKEIQLNVLMTQRDERNKVLGRILQWMRSRRDDHPIKWDGLMTQALVHLWWKANACLPDGHPHKRATEEVAAGIPAREVQHIQSLYDYNDNNSNHE